MAGRWHRIRSNCRLSVGGDQGCRRKGLSWHRWGSRARGSGQPHPHAQCDRTAGRVSCMTCVFFFSLPLQSVAGIRGSYTSVGVSKVVTLLVIVVERHDELQSAGRGCRWQGEMGRWGGDVGRNNGKKKRALSARLAVSLDKGRCSVWGAGGLRKVLKRRLSLFGQRDGGKPALGKRPR